jgi:hypothetical protein
MDPKSQVFLATSLILDNLRKVLKSKSLHIYEIFDERTHTNIVEFKNRIKALGISPRDIEMMIDSISCTDRSGMVDLCLLVKKLERLE